MSAPSVHPMPTLARYSLLGGLGAQPQGPITATAVRRQRGSLRPVTHNLEAAQMGSRLATGSAAMGHSCSPACLDRMVLYRKMAGAKLAGAKLDELVAQRNWRELAEITSGLSTAFDSQVRLTVRGLDLDSLAPFTPAINGHAGSWHQQHLSGSGRKHEMTSVV